MKNKLFFAPLLLLFLCSSNCKGFDYSKVSGEDVFKIPDQIATVEKSIPEKMAEFDFVTSITDSSSKTLTKGVKESIVEFTTSTTHPLRLCTFEVDVKDASISLEVTFPEERGANWAVRNMVNQVKSIDSDGHRVIGAVNADFFDMGGSGYPCGAVYSNGTAIKTDLSYNENATFFCQLKSGQIILGAKNDYSGIDFETVKEFVQGMYLLAKNGEPVTKYDDYKAPRTAVGISKDGRTLYLVVVDELVPSSPRDGITLTDLGKLMVHIGSFDSVNLDGGGSSTFVVRDGDDFATPNKQPGAYLRPVANGLAIIKN